MEDIEARIRERAHRIWIEEGRPEGRAEAHWREAQRQIEAEAATWHNPAAGRPLPEDEPEDPAPDLPALGADAAANAAITGAPAAGAARRRSAKDRDR
ncbi:DUF2934 domain-containing protein [Prosthecomicrobium sp. N25]|uniref:DUF2934 domain-containing protein n=1 Tax=Prosthecomicrobium sp. N25 TaxID=3129254 RepID=UPI0030769E29